MTLDLNQIRQDIDQIDREIVQLLEKRMTCVSQVIAYKRANMLPVLDSSREQDVLDKVSDLVSNDHYRATILKTFEDIMTQSRAYQAQKNS